MAELTVKIEADFGPTEDLLADINAMQTYKLFENDDMILVDKADLCDILVRHVRVRGADKSPETAADVRPVVQREAVMQALNKYFSIGDSYTYELTRVKEAFYVGTMTLDDFEEWDEDNVSDLCDYLMKEIFGPNCGARMEES